MRYLLCILILFFFKPSIPSYSPRSSYINTGPAIIYYFEGKLTFSWEVTYWSIGDGIPYGADAGIELGKKRFIFYSEIKTGIGILGGSCGLLFGTIDHARAFGIQATGWFGYYVYPIFRKRSMDLFSPIYKHKSEGGAGLILQIPNNPLSELGSLPFGF